MDTTGVDDYYGNGDSRRASYVEDYDDFEEPSSVYYTLGDAFRFFLSDFGEMTVDLWKYCVKGALADWFDLTAYVILSSCLLRLMASYRRVPRPMVHLASCVLGLYCLVGLIDWHGFYVFTFAVLVVTALYVAHWLLGRWRAVIVAGSCLSMIILVGEYQLVPPQWNRIRGTVMLISMKVISLSLDLDSGAVTRLPSLEQLFGYVFHCGTVIFGPWISFYDYYRSIEIFTEEETDSSSSVDLLDPQWLVAVLRSLFLSTVYLVMSSCIIHWLLLDADEYGPWTAAFRDALAFRMSHYFVSFHSESSAVAAGIQRQRTAKDGDDFNRWNLEVVRPSRIELPRSLVDAVVRWNRPMHMWLKRYVYRPLLPRAGQYLAAVGTFAASALLHGLSFRLGAVLLSLGLYTQVEYAVRAKMARRLNACVAARKCRSTCGHRHRGLRARDPQDGDREPQDGDREPQDGNRIPQDGDREPQNGDREPQDGDHQDHRRNRGTTRTWRASLVSGVNIAWTLLAILHLTYLGAMFSDDDNSDGGGQDPTMSFEDQLNGSTLRPTLNKWRELGFASHWIYLATLAVHTVIRL